MDEINLISILFILGLIGTIAFFELSTVIWTVIFGVVLLFFTFFTSISGILLAIYWLIFLSVAAIVHLHGFRQKYILEPFVKKLQKQMPGISSTEKEAIEAGNVWWEKELFCGQPNWNNLFQIPKPTLTNEEQNFINNQVEQLCEMVDDWNIIFKERDLPSEVWEFLKKEKFFGMVIPKEYDGLGFSALAHSTVVMKIATRSISTAVNTMVPNSLGPGELLIHYGTQEQKDYYLPRLAKGEEVPCFALTAPDAGSDAGAIPDHGIVCYGQHEGKEVLGMRLTWDKRYITLAPIATVLGLAVHLYDPDGLLGDKQDIGITLCLLPASHPGVEIGNRHYPAFQAFMNGPTRGKDVFIPLDWIIGGAKMAGQGWRMLMESLSIGRSISLPALATGCGKLSYLSTGAYARIRKQFNLPIAEFEGVEEALAQIAGNAYIIEATRLMTAGAVDLNVRPAIASAIAKYHLTEISRQVMNNASDIHAGQMIQVGPRNPLANGLVAVPISITVEGANILTRNLIIFGQGAIRCHPYLLKEVELLSAQEVDVKALDQTLMQHIGYYFRNTIRSFIYGLTGGIFIFGTVKNKQIKKYQRQLTRMSTALALMADTSLILLGGSLKRKERISARLGDMLSHLYLSSAVLKYYQDEGAPDDDVNNVCWALHKSLYQIQLAADGVFENFPNRFVGAILRFLIFTFGPAYRAPSDALSKSIVKTMLKPSEFRNRLTKNIFLSKETTDTSRRLEIALAQINEVDPIMKKIHKAVRAGEIPAKYNFKERAAKALELSLISQDELQKITTFEALKDEIIKVNEFSFDLQQVIA